MSQPAADDSEETAEAETPYGCRWCGDASHHHGSQWHPTAGMHQWAKPTAEQVKARMVSRRRAADDEEETL
ncbi:hypothetical protein GTW73_21985 [Streptomyces sp. SID4982]|nr:hypothetical protein [Streptomyces sp. SID4982]